MRPGSSRPLGFAVVLLLLAVALNAHHYLTASGDASTGLYLYVAELWLHGHLPYLAAWEYKPPGLFAYFAIALALTREHATLAAELLTTLSAFATALVLWRLGPRVDATGAGRTGRYAALFYVLLAPENEGFLGDAEVLLAPFLAAALLATTARRATLGLIVLAGLLGGCALQMKLSALPLVAVPALVLARRSGRPLRVIGIYTIAALSPFALEAVVYAQAGALPALLDANVGATVRRAAGLRGGIVRENLGWFLAQLRVLAPAVELAPLGLAAHVNRQRTLTYGWLAAALIAIAGAGEFYDRQFVLLEAPVALLGGLGLRVATDALRRGSRAPAFAVAAAFVATFALHDYWETAQTLGIAYHRVVLHEPRYRAGDYAETLAAVEPLPHRSLLVLQRSPLLYSGLGVASPTRYPDSDHLLDPRMNAMTGVRGVGELARIFAARPAVVIAGKIREPRFDPAAVAFVEVRLARDYRCVATLSAQTKVYVRDGASTSPPRRPK